MKYVSVCAGIEAATVAWHPLGWEPVLFSEIEPFPCAVLKHHHPEVPLVGDFTQLITDPPKADLLVGGTPCQAFSVAGKRLSLEDYRGNLSLAFADLFHAGQYRWCVWENVPGVLSTKDNAFGCFLGRMVGADAPLLPSRGGKWTNAGVVSGPLAVAAWRVLDAQYFGVAQRRRRVFVCVSRGAGNWAAAEALLPVGESVSRHPPTRPEAGQGTPAAFETGPGGGRFTDLAPTMDARAKDGPIRNQLGVAALGGGEWPARLAPTLNAAFAEKQGLEDQHINGGAGMFVLDKQGGQVTEHISPTLKTDLSHQMGPVVAFPLDLRNAGRDPDKHDAMNRQGVGTGEAGDPAPTVSSAFVHGVAFAIQTPDMVEKSQSGAGISEGPMYTLESSRPHGVVAPSVTGGPPFSRTGNERVEAEVLVVSLTTEQTPKYADGIAQTLTKGSPTGGGHPQAVAGVALRPRRLTPRECERLQGFPDGYTNIPWKKGTAPDGPRYKALGNSMAVPCMYWIGKRIQGVES